MQLLVFQKVWKIHLILCLRVLFFQIEYKISLFVKVSQIINQTSFLLWFMKIWKMLLLFQVFMIHNKNNTPFTNGDLYIVAFALKSWVTWNEKNIQFCFKMFFLWTIRTGICVKHFFSIPQKTVTVIKENWDKLSVYFSIFKW